MRQRVPSVGESISIRAQGDELRVSMGPTMEFSIWDVVCLLHLVGYHAKREAWLRRALDNEFK